MRLAAFIIALLLLGGSIDPTRGWFITLVVLTGIAAIRPKFWNWFHVQPAVDMRLAAFVLCAVLLAGGVDATRDWLIALSVLTGLAAFMPGIIGGDPFHSDHHGIRGHGRWRRGRAWRWQWNSGSDWGDHADDGWARWEQRMDRRMERQSDRGGDDWS